MRREKRRCPGFRVFALIDRGDEALVPDPGWPNYRQILNLVGGVSVQYPMSVENGYLPDPATLEKLITPKTKMIITCNPGNPTGAVWSEVELSALAEVVKVHPRLMVLSDEIYEYILFDGKMTSFASLPGMRERTITVNGFSKSFAMTGWRLGYVAGPPDLIGPLLKVHQVTTTCATSFAQWGGVAAYGGDQACVAEMVAEFARRRTLIVDALRAMPGVTLAPPRGAFYTFPDVTALGMPDVELAEGPSGAAECPEVRSPLHTRDARELLAEVVRVALTVVRGV